MISSKMQNSMEHRRLPDYDNFIKTTRKR